MGSGDLGDWGAECRFEEMRLSALTMQAKLDTPSAGPTPELYGFKVFCFMGSSLALLQGHIKAENLTHRHPRDWTQGLLLGTRLFSKGAL